MAQGKHDIMRTFETFDEFVEYSAGGNNSDKTRKSRFREGGLDNRWDLGAGWEGALKLARTGWEEGTQRMIELRDKLESISSVIMSDQSFKHSDDGSEVDVDAYLEGEPDCFIEFIDELARGFEPQVFKIVVNLGVSSSISADRIEQRGAAVLALVDMLESAGHRCEIEIVKATGSGRGTALWQMRTVLKEAGEPMATDRLAFALVHPATHRRLIFSAEEREPIETRAWYGFGDGKVGGKGRSLDGGYGQPAQITGDKGDVYLPALNYSTRDKQSWLNSDEETAKWIKSQLEKAGVELEPRY